MLGRCAVHLIQLELQSQGRERFSSSAGCPWVLLSQQLPGPRSPVRREPRKCPPGLKYMGSITDTGCASQSLGCCPHSHGPPSIQPPTLSLASYIQLHQDSAWPHTSSSHSLHLLPLIRSLQHPPKWATCHTEGSHLSATVCKPVAHSLCLETPHSPCAVRQGSSMETHHSGLVHSQRA